MHGSAGRAAALGGPGGRGGGRLSPRPSVCLPAGRGARMGSGAPTLVLACCVLLTFACGAGLGRAPRGAQELREQEGTKEPPLDHTER